MEDLLNARDILHEQIRTTQVSVEKAGGNPNGYVEAYFLLEEETLSSSFLFERCKKVTLSELGKLKCSQIFDIFDSNQNGYWSIVDFRNYLLYLQRQNYDQRLVEVMQHEEMWSMYMCDAYETNSNGQLTLQVS